MLMFSARYCMVQMQMPWIHRATKARFFFTTSKISEDQLFYAQARGLSQDDAIGLIVNGFCREVMQKLPMEFAIEAQRLIGIQLEGSVG